MSDDRPTTTPWHPIETAPRDGTKVLAFDPTGSDCDAPGLMAVVYWWRHEWTTYEAIGNGLFREKVETLTECWEGGPYSPFRATHWMPLPEPPDDARGTG